MKQRELIRPANDADSDRCAAIFLECCQRFFHWLEPGDYLRADFLESLSQEKAWVLEVEGVVNGFVSVYEPEAFVHHLYVDPAWHERGLGTLLIGKAAATTGRPLHLKTAVANEAANRFYANKGWEEVERGAHPTKGRFILWRK